MKKRLVLLGIIAAALSVSCANGTAVNNNSSERQIVTTKSSRYYNENTSVTSGLFVKVTNPDTISSGEELLMVGDETSTFTYFVGASYHYWVTTEGSELTHYSDDFYYLDSKKVELISFVRTGQSFYLKLNHYADNTDSGNGKARSGYIVHEAYNNNGVTAFGDLYIRGKQDQPSAAASKWNLSYVDGHMRIVSQTDRLMVHKRGNSYMWDSFIASTHTEWSSNINLYRRVSYGDVFVSANATNVTTKTYTPGDEIDLTGLQVQANYYVANSIALTINSSFSSHPDLFKPLYISYYEKFVHFTWCGLESGYSVSVSHDTSDEHQYSKPDTQIRDLRGTYVFAASFRQTDNSPLITAALKPSSVSTGTAGDAEFEIVGFTYGEDANPSPILDTIYATNPENDKKNTAVTNNLIEVVVAPFSTSDYVEYITKIGSQSLYIETFYPDGENPMTYEPFGKLKRGSASSATSANTITTDSNNYVYIGSNIERQLVLELSESLVDGKITTIIPGEYGVRQYPLCLFKLQMTDNLKYLDTELNDFKSTFFSKTSDYDPTGATKNITKINWGSLETSFNNLSPDAQSYLASLTYTHNQEKDDSFEQLVDRYDSIINTYYDVESGYDEYYQTPTYGFKDFMSRGLAQTLQSQRNVTFNCRDSVIDGSSGAEFKSAYSATLVPDAHCKCPTRIEITMGSKTLQENVHYTYNFETGAIVINKDLIVDDIVITAEAELVQYTIAFIGKKADGEEMVCFAYASDSFTLPTYANIGFDSAPAGKQFKCWMVKGVEKNPGETIDVDDNTEIRAVYESINPAGRAVENNVSTVPYLSYEYEKDGNNFTFSNVAIRFRSMVGKTLWEQLDGDSNNITGFGVLFTTEETLAGTDLKNLFDSASVDENIKIFRSSKSVPTLLTIAQYGNLINEDSYSWNLKVNIASTTEKLTTRYAAVAFVETVDSGIIFVSQSIASVKSIAQDMMATDDYDENFEDGALNYLANL